MNWLPVTAGLRDYESQAEMLLEGHRRGDPEALALIHRSHPRFLDAETPWLPQRLSMEQIREAAFDGADARLALARLYSFRDWASLSDLVNAVAARAPGVYEFEIASEAVIEGDLPALEALLRAHPELAGARSSRITNHDPARHRATLLHYVAANGVESYRQRTPANAVAIAQALLAAGSDPNALAGMYGGECTTLSMLASSGPPAEAGVQTLLVDALIDGGADPNERGSGNWTNPLMTALLFGFEDAARALVRRGARVDRLSLAAGLGRLEEAGRMLPDAGAEERHRALALAAQLGRAPVVHMLLEAGEDPNRFNPQGMHAHGTPLHHAAGAGDLETVRLLIENGARTDMADKLWRATPAGWAEHEGKAEVAAFLRERSGG